MSSAIKLKPISYMVLGMLRLGAKSGYAIKKVADVSTRNFWPVSLAQVYPELARLESHELVTRHEDPRGARERSAYELTDKGEAALTAWLRSSVEAPPKVRSEGLLRLFFADALPKDDQLKLVGRMLERNRRSRDDLQDGGPQSVADIPPGDIRFPQIVRLYGESIAAHGSQWLEELEAELRKAQPDD